MPNDDDLPPLDDETQAAIDSLGIDPEPNGAPPVPSAPAERRRGKDRRPRRRAGAVVTPQASAPAPPPVAPPAAPVSDGTKDALTVWPRILQEMTEQGYAPGAIGIKITRTPTGPSRGPAVQLSPIDGALVAGSGDPNGPGPGEELYSYIRDYYHMAFGAGSGPARYDLSFYKRAGGGNIPGTAEIVLDHPDAIRRQIAAEEEIRRAKQYGSAPHYPTRYYAPPPMPSVPGGPPMQQQSYTSRDMEQVRELAGSNGYLRGLLEMHEKHAAQPAPTAAPPTPVYDPRSPPPGLTAQEWEEIQTKRMASAVGPAVVQALVAMGFTPNTTQAAPAAAVAPQTPPDPVDIVDAALKMIQKFAGAQARITEAMGAVTSAAPGVETAEDPLEMKPILGGEPIPGIGVPRYGRRLEDEPWFEYAVRWGTNNMGALQKLFAYLGDKIPPDAMQKLAEAIASRRATPAASGTPAPPQMGWQPSGSST